MCPCTTFAVAVTVLNEEQSSLAHRLKVREVPTVGGPASSSAEGATAPAPVCGANPYHRNRSPCRRKSWNCWAGDWVASDAISAATGVWTVSPTSRKLDETPGEPAADCGMSRYSAESIADVLAGKITHPESRMGSIETNESTANDTAKPRPPVHAGRGTGLGGDVPSLHATAAASSSDDLPTHLRLARNMQSLRHFARPHQRPPEADGANHFMYPNHRDKQRFQRDPPLGESPARGGGQAQGHASLRDKPQPPLAGYGGRHIPSSPCSRPPQTVAQAPHAQPHQ